MSFGEKPGEFASAWVKGEVGNGVGAPSSGEFDPIEPRPTPEEITETIKGLNDWRENNPDQESYLEWWNLWQKYSTGAARPLTGMGMEGWTTADFKAVFDGLKAPQA